MYVCVILLFVGTVFLLMKAIVLVPFVFLSPVERRLSSVIDAFPHVVLSSPFNNESIVSLVGPG